MRDGGPGTERAHVAGRRAEQRIEKARGAATDRTRVRIENDGVGLGFDDQRDRADRIEISW
jgi:hypothetical protein